MEDFYNYAYSDELVNKTDEEVVELARQGDNDAQEYLIGKYKNFTRAGNRIDADIAKYGFLCQCNEDIARACNLIYLRNRLRTKSHSSDRLGSTYFVDFIYTCDFGSYCSAGIDSAIFSRRCGHDDFADSCYFSRYHIHQYTGRISGLSTRYIYTNSF